MPLKQPAALFKNVNWPSRCALFSPLPQIRAALSLLTSVASLSPGIVEELVRVFDFSLSSLPGIARPSR